MTRPISRAAREILRHVDAFTESDYWDLVNYIGQDARARNLAERNAQRALDGLISRGMLEIGDLDGDVRITAAGRAILERTA